LILQRKILNAFAIVLLVTFITASMQISISKAESAYTDVNILSHTGYLDNDGFYYVYGEVQNVGSQTLSYTDITADFYDQSGAKIGNYRTNAMLNNLWPSEKSPFQIVVYSKADSARVFRYDISVGGYMTTNAFPEKLSLKAHFNEFYPDDPLAQIDGTYYNHAADNAVFVRVIATYYDSSGKVLFAAFDSKDVSAPGSSDNRFVINFLGERARLISSYRLVLESNEYSGDSGVGWFHINPAPSPSIPEFPPIALAVLVIVLAITGITVVFKKSALACP
jgi:hypothetical protein